MDIDSILDSFSHGKITSEQLEYMLEILQNEEDIVGMDRNVQKDLEQYLVLEIRYWKIVEDFKGQNAMNSANYERAFAQSKEQLKGAFNEKIAFFETTGKKRIDELDKELKLLKEKQCHIHNTSLKVEQDRKTLKMQMDNQQLVMDNLSKRMMTMKKIFTRNIIEATKQISHFKVLFVRQKIKIRKFRERDLEEEHQKNKVEDVKKQIQKLAMLKDKLKALISMQNSSEKSGNYQSAYLDFTIERIRLSMVIFEQNIQNLEGFFKNNEAEIVRIKMMECLEEGKLIIITISALEMEMEEDISEEVEKLIENIGKLEKISFRIPEVKMGRHLEKVLEDF